MDLNVQICSDGSANGNSGTSEQSDFDSPSGVSRVAFGRIDRLLQAQPAVQAIREDMSALTRLAFQAWHAAPRPQAAPEPTPLDALQCRVARTEYQLEQLFGADGTIHNMMVSMRELHEYVMTIDGRHAGSTSSRHGSGAVGAEETFPENSVNSAEPGLVVKEEIVIGSPFKPDIVVVGTPDVQSLTAGPADEAPKMHGSQWC